MAISFGERRILFQIEQEGRVNFSIAVPLSVAVTVAVKLQRSGGGGGRKRAPSFAVFQHRDGRECWQAQHVVDVFARADAVVEIFKFRRKTDTETERKQKREHNTLKAIWTNRHARRRGVVSHVQVVRSAGEDDVVFL